MAFRRCHQIDSRVLQMSATCILVAAANRKRVWGTEHVHSPDGSRLRLSLSEVQAATSRKRSHWVGVCFSTVDQPPFGSRPRGAR